MVCVSTVCLSSCVCIFNGISPRCCLLKLFLYCFGFIGQKFFRRRGIRDLLPARPVSITRVEPWWVVHVGFVTEDDIRVRERVGGGAKDAWLLLFLWGEGWVCA